MTHEKLDSKLINELLEDGRASFRTLSERIGVSVATISRHLSGLEERGVIVGYVPKIKYEKLGYGLTAIIQLKVEGALIPDITSKLVEYEQMISIYEVTGDYDLIIIAKFRDTLGMNKQIKAILIDPIIKASNTSVVLNAIVENRQFCLSEYEEMNQEYYGNVQGAWMKKTSSVN